MQNLWTRYQKHALWSGCLVMLILLLAGCGGAMSAATSSTGSSMAVPHTAPVMDQAKYGQMNSQNSSAGSSASGQQKVPVASVPQYLIKTLKVSMNVKDTRMVANDLQTWISSTDNRASTAGADYEQAGDNLYNVSMTFSVQASLYPQIYNYLRDYTRQKGGQLQSFTESVQDVTNDYVDTQSRLKNLRIEQQRIQTLLSQAQSMKDILDIEQKLTDVEGQIEGIEAHLNLLNSQVTFYTVTVTLQPLDNVPPPPPTPGWNAGQVFHDAFSASLAFAQGLINFIIWLFAFSFYLVPVALIIWLVWRVRNHPRRATPKPAETTDAPVPDL